MTELHLPEGYSLEETKEFTVLHKEGKIVFVRPAEYFSLKRIKEIIEEIEGAIKYVQSC